MYETLKRLWEDRAINGMTEAKLDVAVAKNWITELQKSDIMATPTQEEVANEN